MLLGVQAQLESYLVILCTLSVACILRPHKVLEQGLIYVLGDAMNLARPSEDPTCVVVGGLLLFQVFFIYLFALLKTDMMFFKDLAPFRTIQAFVLVLWIYFSNNPAMSNGLTFTFAFFDLIWQFWMFVSFRGYKPPVKT
ncbi:unnamed protein product [Pneumocystis jirovecii]|uniref:Uncharacterized protein n=2 Tax=Pneumocystis jirovecii TaxID=42068 RepID=A0A0W4ZCJ8_PNEJ7|nr:uncharacterized protein T551_03609 [Pneumocystis jirovecii RU7]XP_018228445.1 uncharacterized protein T551_02974 [Pneumocystis jirovecii RU7]KTW26037.1 hypothetical protein T551_03609 [Pneumocystis jirovecii RU7]KTW27475.1 hypothetical protein T551_02974 [Pneumocystis jirovecii RU7]CCJ30213.1 unnamed protein product [Pneumocystis jirovecii]